MFLPRSKHSKFLTNSKEARVEKGDSYHIAESIFLSKRWGVICQKFIVQNTRITLL